MKRIIAIALALVLALGLVACGSTSSAPAASGTQTETKTEAKTETKADPIVLKFSDCHNPTATNHLAFKKMAEIVKERTNGAVEIEVYPANQLGDVSASQEAIQMNTLDMAVTNLAVLGAAIPDFGAVAGPFMWDSDDHIRRAMDGELGEYYANEAAEKGLNICGYLFTGFRNTFTSVPVRSVADFAGLKIRTMENPVDVAIFNSIGAQGTPMAYGELFTAIQQKTVDGGENTIANYLTDGFAEVAPYLCLSGHTYNICVILISDEAIEKIPEDLRQTFFDACKEGCYEATEMVLAANDDAIEKLKEMGCEINEIDRDELYKLCEPLYEQFAGDRIPPELVAMVKAAK